MAATTKMFEMRFQAHDGLIGSSSSLLVMSISDQVLAYGGKVVFAVLTAALASFVSGVIRNWTERKYPK